MLADGVAVVGTAIRRRVVAPRVRMSSFDCRWQFPTLAVKDRRTQPFMGTASSAVAAKVMVTAAAGH